MSRTEYDDYHHYDYARTLRYFCFGFTISQSSSFLASRTYPERK